MHRRLRLSLLFIALVGLAFPAVAAADVPAGDWQITAIVFGGERIRVEGKLSLQNQVSASVGCNSMGGPFTIDGATISIGQLTSTLIGCPADLAKAEGALMKILTAGPITIAADRWTSAGGEIDIIDAGVAGGGGAPECIPPVAPGANPPDNVTVPCGNGEGGGSGSGNGSTIDSNGPLSTTTDPTTLLVAGALAVLAIATIGAFIYMGPRRTPGGGTEE